VANVARGHGDCLYGTKEFDHPPKYFHVDQRLTCHERGAEFTWPAAVQRLWYEELRLAEARATGAKAEE
jgi:hypothetical protein